MLRLATLLSNKAVEPMAAETEARSRDALIERSRQITDVEIPAALEADDAAALGRLRAERQQITEQLDALDEMEAHARRRSASAALQEELQRLETERADIEAKLSAHGAAFEELAVNASATWTAYGTDWERMENYNRRVRELVSRHPGAPISLLVAEQGLGAAASLRHDIAQLIAVHTRLVQRREWELPENVARRAKEEAKRAAQEREIYNSREMMKRRGVIDRKTVPRYYDGAIDSDRRG